MQGNFPRKNREKQGAFCIGQTSPPSCQHIRQPQQHTGAHHGDQEGGKAPIGMETDEGEQPVAQGRADDANDDVADERGGVVHEFAGQPTDEGTADQGPDECK